MSEHSDGSRPLRHPGTEDLLRYFEYDHLPAHLQAVSKPCGDLVQELVAVLPDGPELSAGLRKLLEAKDCFVRAALDTTPEN
ncbi:hypothetical protein ABZ351_18100 [Streptomyces microflavus]|uniref:hypothetical protein n=1 Tax=Streptomyces microflavus TaxID=1919 RepID=UPI0033CCE619